MSERPTDALAAGTVAAPRRRARLSGATVRPLDAIRVDRFFAVGVATLAVMVIVALLYPVLTPYDAAAPDPDATLTGPSWAHPFGTDQFGRDVLARTLAATRVDLLIAGVAVVVSMVIGTVAGALAGYFGRWMDTLLMRGVDVIMVFPVLVVGLALVAVVGVGEVNVIVATVVVNVPIFARLARSEVLSRRELDYVHAAVCSGTPHLRILFRHLLPNCSGPIAVQASLSSAWAILNVAALSFIGIGVEPPTPEWGVMVAEGAAVLSQGAWWLSVFPGLAIMVSVLAFNMIGDGLQDRLNPRRTRR